MARIAIWLVSAMVLAGAAPFWGCSAPDPGAVVYDPRLPNYGSPGTGQTGGTGGDEGGAPGAMDSGILDARTVTEAAAEAAADGPSGGAGVFKGAPAYDATQQPQQTAAQNHQAQGVATVPNKKTDCMTCHNGTTASGFLFGGTIYTDTGATRGAAGIEVRVVDSTGNGYSAYSDSDGNFWIDNDTAASLPGTSGARDGSGNVQLMIGSTTSPGCNSCHNGTIDAVMHLP